MLASINLVPASSRHPTQNIILYEFPFICQLVSKSASALNDRKGCGTGQIILTGWFCNTLGQGITGRHYTDTKHKMVSPRELTA